MAIIAFFSGLGTTFGAEIAKTVFAKINSVFAKRANKKHDGTNI
jgi:hypothetical protein